MAKAYIGDIPVDKCMLGSVEVCTAPPPPPPKMQIRVWAADATKAAPASVTGGSYTSKDQGDGSYMIESNDDITRVSWKRNKDITRVDVIIGDTITNVSGAWNACSGLTSFDASGLTAAENISSAWLQCSSIITFNTAGLTSATDASSAWAGMDAMTSFDASGITAVTNIADAWSYNPELLCISSMTAPTTKVLNAFKNSPKLVHPDAAEQAAHFTTSGTNWTHPGTCP